MPRGWSDHAQFPCLLSLALHHQADSINTFLLAKILTGLHADICCVGSLERGGIHS